MKKEIKTQDGKTIIYEESFWIGKRTIVINGKTLDKVSKNVYTDGSNDYVIKGNQFFGLSIINNNEIYVIYEKLNAFQIILACIPLIMVFIGGAIGGALGALGFFVIILAIRCYKNSILVNIITSIAVSALVFGLWYILAILINSLIL